MIKLTKENRTYELALIGNCQLSVIGQLLNAFFSQNGLEHNMVYRGALYDLGGKNMLSSRF